MTHERYMVRDDLWLIVISEVFMVNRFYTQSFFLFIEHETNENLIRISLTEKR